jgi:hypothetical protein
VPVPPAVGEPLAEAGARNLPAQFCLEPAAGFASAAGHRALDVAQLGLHVRLERAGEGRGKLHVSTMVEVAPREDRLFASGDAHLEGHPMSALALAIRLD